MDVSLTANLIQSRRSFGNHITSTNHEERLPRRTEQWVANPGFRVVRPAVYGRWGEKGGATDDDPNERRRPSHSVNPNGGCRESAESSLPTLDSGTAVSPPPEIVSNEGCQPTRRTRA